VVERISERGRQGESGAPDRSREPMR
jgi:hypothetical protein